MPQQQQTTVQQAPQKKSSPIFGMLGSLLTPFLGPAAGAAGGFLQGLTGGGSGGGTTSTAASVTTPGGGEAAGGAGGGEASDSSMHEMGQQAPVVQPQQFQGPQTAAPGVPGQVGMEGGQVDPQQQAQDQVFQHLETMVPDLPFQVQQNPQFLVGLQNFTTAAQQRYLRPQQGGGGFSG